MFRFFVLFCFFWCASPSLASPIVSSLVPHCSCCGSAGAVRVLAGSRRPAPFSCKSPDRPISLPTFVLIRLFSSRNARISPAPASASIAPSSSSISHISKTIQTTLLLPVWISPFLLAFAHCLCAFALSLCFCLVSWLQKMSGCGGQMRPLAMPRTRWRHERAARPKVQGARPKLWRAAVLRRPLRPSQTGPRRARSIVSRPKSLLPWLTT